MNDSEKKIYDQECGKKPHNRSNTRKTFKRKAKMLGYGAMIGGVLMMSSCGSSDSDLTKLSKKYDDAVENVKKQKGELKDAQEELKEAQERVEKEKKDIVNAEKEAAEIKGELQKAKVNPIGE